MERPIKQLVVTEKTIFSEIEAFSSRQCARCGHRADEHLRLHQKYLCPILQTFLEPEEEKK